MFDDHPGEDALQVRKGSRAVGRIVTLKLGNQLLVLNDALSLTSDVLLCQLDFFFYDFSIRHGLENLSQCSAP